MIRKQISSISHLPTTPPKLHKTLGPHLIQVTPVHPYTLRPRYTLTIQTLQSTRAPWPVTKSAAFCRKENAGILAGLSFLFSEHWNKPGEDGKAKKHNIHRHVCTIYSIIWI